MQLCLEDVRCFRGRKEVRLAPLTILVGENSAGKTSFMATFRAAWNLWHGLGEYAFNEEPFFMGGFEQIAHHRGGNAGRAKSFAVRLSIPVEPHRRRERALFPSLDARPLGDIAVEGLFEPEAGQPRLAELSVMAGGVTTTARMVADGGCTVSVSWSGSNIKVEVPVRERWRSMTADWMLWLAVRDRMPRPREEAVVPAIPIEVVAVLEETQELLRQKRDPPVIAFAPVRTKPARTYDPTRDQPEPGGGHVPMVLSRLFAPGGSEASQLLKSRLEAFGVASGLFRRVKVKRLGGKKESDPFQIQISVGGPAANLLDVGYGVSQVLPVVVDAMRGAKRQTYLLQQPEVHLHPRAQAELGSLLSTLVRAEGKRFLVETHSDHLIDRVRMEVRGRKTLRPEDVLVLYLERKGGESTIHEIEIDKMGNVVGAPPSYREFFFREQERLLFGGEE